MAAIQFYHLTATPLEHALPKLLEKALAAGFRSVLLADSQARLDALNQWLWAYDAASFLPHGLATEPHAEMQPILLSVEMTTQNQANLALITDGRLLETENNFSRVLDMFDGSDEAATTAARQRWTHYKNAGHEISYFRQNERGGWEKKA